MQSVTIRPASRTDINDLVGLIYLLFFIEEDFIFNENLPRRGLQLMLANDLGWQTTDLICLCKRLSR